MATSSGKSKYGSILNRKTLTLRNTPTTTASASSSSFKSVCLHRWWLTKPLNGPQGLAVAGFSSREGRRVRAFRSAAISKRHDATTVEAADGFRISIVGFIDEHQTRQSGFSLEVCSRFHFGFPYNWEEYAARGPTEVLSISTNAVAKDTIKTRSHNMKNDRRPESSDDPPVTRKRDLLICGHQESDWRTMTMKAVDDLFECLGKLEDDESSSSPECTNAKLSEVAHLKKDQTQSTNSDACFLQEFCVLSKESVDTGIRGNSFHSGSLSDPPSARKHGHINKHLESNHIMPTNREIIDLEDTESSSPSEEINVDSAAALRLLIETPTIPKVEGKSQIIGDKPLGHRRITRSMTEVKTRKSGASGL